MVKVQMTFSIAMNDGARGYHFGIHNDVWIKQTGKKAIVTSCPIHHRRDRNAGL